MAERSVCMRVCRHLVASRCFAFRALIMPTQARIWKRFRVQNSTCLLYLPIPLTAETCKIVTNKPCQFKIACVASVSAGVRRESWKESKKKNDGGGGGGGERRNRLPANHTIFKKPRSPTNAASDWCGASSVDWLALETSIKPGICFIYERHRSGLIWFVVADYKCFGLIFIWIVLCKGLWDQSLQSIFGDRAVEIREGQFIGNDGVQIWLKKKTNVLFVMLEITST